MNNLLELKNISAAYEKQTVLRNINLSVSTNDFIGIIGPNGGGKTTLLKLILELINPTSGEIKKHPKLNIGYLPQVLDIDKKFPITVEEVILSGRFTTNSWWKKATKTNKTKCKELIEFVGLTEKTNQPIGELSGGQMQRVLLCRALMSQPNLLILDEPNTYVDKAFEQDLYKLLHELNQNMAIILVSHDVGTISSLVKTIACVNGSLHHHKANTITNEILESYNCPIEIISHGIIPHRVLKNH